MYMKPPTSWDLAHLNMCKCYSNIEYTKPAEVICRDGVELILNMEICGRSVKSAIREFVNLRFIETDKEKYHQFFDQLISTIVQINKKVPIAGRKYTNTIQLGDDPPTYYTAQIDMLYNRSDGPCYSVVLHDILGDILPEHIASHPVVCATVLAAQVDLRNIDRYTPGTVEAIVPSDPDDKFCQRFTIKLDDNTEVGKYIDHCRNSIGSLLRRYILEEKHTPNWSHKCLWCPQKGRCDSFRSTRKEFRAVIQRI